MLLTALEANKKTVQAELDMRERKFQNIFKCIEDATKDSDYRIRLSYGLEEDHLKRLLDLGYQVHTNNSDKYGYTTTIDWSKV